MESEPRGQAADDLTDLVARSQAGDGQALSALLLRLEPRALAIARQMGLSPEDAQDAAQDALLKLFRYLRRFRAGESFRGWFYRIVVHATYDHLRRAGQGAAARRPVRLAAELVDAGPGTGETAELRQQRDRILAEVRALPTRQRAAFVLRDLEGLDTRVVARALRVREVTVRRQVQNARRRLRDRLRREFPDLFS